MELKLDKEALKELYEKGVTPSQLIYLWSYIDDEILIKVTPLDIVNLKVHGFLDDENITEEGLTFLRVYLPEDRGDSEELFKKLFELCPLSDKYGTHPRTRTIRSNAKIAYPEFVKALSKYPYSTIYNGMVNEIQFRKDATDNGTTNAFKFMKSLNNWLAAEEFTIYNNLEVDNFRAMYGKDIE